MMPSGFWSRLEAQMDEMQRYLHGQQNYSVIADLVEVQSGKDDKNRPVLQEAMIRKLNWCSASNRLCRLSRDLEFVAGLMKSKVKFRIATNPHADEFTIGIYALIGMKERQEIGRRTSRALQVAKRRGVRLGTAGARNIKKANEAKVSAANAFALKIQPMVEPLKKQEKLSLLPMH